jgi:hypothetical protein
VGSIEEQRGPLTQARKQQHGLFNCLSAASLFEPKGRVEKKSEPLARWEAAGRVGARVSGLI